MIVFEFEKEDIGYAERISDLAEMSLLIEDPKSFSSDLNTVIQIGVELAPYAITGITLIIVELIKNRKKIKIKVSDDGITVVLKAFRQYFIQLWDQADMEQEAMMTLYQLLKKFPDLEKDDDKLRRYFKTKFRNRLNDEVRRQESVKRQANRQCYVEISDIAFCIPNKELDMVDRLAYDEQLNAFREQLSSEDSLKLDRLLGGECFRGRKKMIRELRFWMVDFDPCNEED